ncbi:DUF6504 family protein [Micropruina sonneratiae]|uniref:DUF6504 family protein n=1 Tax=Micropruina sonneratiae TaxID=2986940 RepID=UPI00222665E5|nr:DUF6504 family protein [Micropruina sp. KQZ13P-5]MCW3157126.1 DUF6504 family protein [Micropruina sp. KQZ13P-5]
MRRYDETIEVRQGLVGDDEGPAVFLWRHKVWKVTELQTRWVETAAWWNSAQVRAARGDDTPGAEADDDLLGEQEVWRVVAADGRLGVPGVYELARSWGSGSWRLRAAVD